MNEAMMHLVTKIIPGILDNPVIALEYLILLGGFWYFGKKLKKIGDDMSALKKDIESQNDEHMKTYAKLTDVQAIWREMSNMRDGIQSGFSGINAQLTQIAAAIIAGHK